MKYTLHSAHSKEELLRRLKLATDEKSIFVHVVPKHHKFIGTINGFEFSVRPLHSYRLSANPLILGRIISHTNEEGCTLLLTLTVPTIVIIFPIITIGLLILLSSPFGLSGVGFIIGALHLVIVISGFGFYKAESNKALKVFEKMVA